MRNYSICCLVSQEKAAANESDCVLKLQYLIGIKLKKVCV